MSDRRQDDGSFGVAVFAVLVGCFALGVSICTFAAKLEPPPKPCQCKPAPTPASCCKADECKQGLAQVDARFGGVWDELAQLHEDVAKLTPCGCGPVKECACDPSKPCACSGKPACECKPAAGLPKRLILKRCK